MADRGGAVADLDVGDRFLAALDAVQPVLHMVVTLVEVDLVAADRFLDQVGRIGGHLAAKDFNLSFVPDKYCTPGLPSSSFTVTPLP